MASEASRLLGELKGKHLLELGCAAPDAVIARARQGATVIAVDPHVEVMRRAREAVVAADARVELHVSDLADLAFLRADSVDAAWSDGALATVPDLPRVFRQVHRVLRPGAPLVFTLPHPMMLSVRVPAEPGGALVLARSYFDEAAVDLGTEGAPVLVQPHSIASVFAALHRAGFRVDTLLEPEPARTPGSPGRPAVPEFVVWRARKEGV